MASVLNYKITLNKRIMFANSHNLLKIVRSNLLILYFQAKQANFCEASKVISKCIYLQAERIVFLLFGSQKV